MARFMIVDDSLFQRKNLGKIITQLGGQVTNTPVYLGERSKVPMVGGRDLVLTLPRQWRRNLLVAVGAYLAGGGVLSEAEVREILRPWSPWRGLLAFYLLAHQRRSQIGLDHAQ